MGEKNFYDVGGVGGAGMKLPEGDAFVSRHSLKPDKDNPESKEYPGITEPGVELSRQNAPEILEMLEKAERGTVMFIGGSSEAIRTKSTARVFGDEIKEIINKDGRDDIIVLTESDFAANRDENSKVISQVQETIANNPDKKILIDFPLFVKQFNLNDRWMDNGKLTEFAQEMLKVSKEKGTSPVREWFANEGKLQIGDRILEGPNPTQVAEEHIEGIKRLQQFANKYAMGRPLTIGMTGHSWNLDAMATYLANDGKVNPEGFEKIGGQIINDSEIGKVEMTEQGPVLKYKGQEFEIEKAERQMAA